ncbi:hypothetical protein CEB94_28330 [Streptomyces hawaiiensis]|uniref:Uncharacterized protein n=1 Tax=Streptomyces hawaiiensis TaxID=67305 RepID=A0A6G5RJK6_9ACTN|nr:hypothetical protein CEB94_28330 [Streptomyces hawaiiensis]
MRSGRVWCGDACLGGGARCLRLPGGGGSGPCRGVSVLGTARWGVIPTDCSLTRQPAAGGHPPTRPLAYDGGCGPPPLRACVPLRAARVGAAAPRRAELRTHPASAPTPGA